MTQKDEIYWVSPDDTKPTDDDKKKLAALSQCSLCQNMTAKAKNTPFETGVADLIYCLSVYTDSRCMPIMDSLWKAGFFN